MTLIHSIAYLKLILEADAGTSKNKTINDSMLLPVVVENDFSLCNSSRRLIERQTFSPKLGIRYNAFNKETLNILNEMFGVVISLGLRLNSRGKTPFSLHQNDFHRNHQKTFVSISTKIDTLDLLICLYCLCILIKKPMDDFKDEVVTEP